MTQVAQEQPIQSNVTIRPPATPTSSTATGDGGRLVVFLHALAFVIGFTVVFTVLGSLAGLIGQSFSQPFSSAQPRFDRYVVEALIQRIGAVVLVVFALITLGVFRWLVNSISRRTDLASNPAAAALVSILEFFNRLLYTEKRITPMHSVNRSWGYLSSALLGVSFSAGWVPCVGPILGGITTLATNSATVGQGALLLGIYSLGLGIPFLITGAAFSNATRLLRRLNRYANVVSVVSGLFLLLIAYLLWHGELITLTARFDLLNQLMLRAGEWTSNIEMNLSTATPTGDLRGLSVGGIAPLAFFAGLLSFLSPCVLPLIPAYIGYLSGAAVSSHKS